MDIFAAASTETGSHTSAQTCAHPCPVATAIQTQTCLANRRASGGLTEQASQQAPIRNFNHTCANRSKTEAGQSCRQALAKCKTANGCKKITRSRRARRESMAGTKMPATVRLRAGYTSQYHASGRSNKTQVTLRDSHCCALSALMCRLRVCVCVSVVLSKCQ